MLTFSASDGYSYLIKVNKEKPLQSTTYRLDSNSIDIALGTNETLEISRLDIKPELSLRIKNLSDIFEV
jgi:hypothetical protein